MTPAVPLMPMSPTPVYMYGGIVGTPMVRQPTAVAGPMHSFFMPEMHMARQGSCTEVKKEWTVRRSVTAKAASSKSDMHGDTPVQVTAAAAQSRNTAPVEALMPAENEQVNEDASMPSTKTIPYEENWSKTEVAPMSGVPQAQEPEETRGMLSCCRFLPASGFIFRESGTFEHDSLKIADAGVGLMFAVAAAPAKGWAVKMIMKKSPADLSG